MSLNCPKQFNKLGYSLKCNYLRSMKARPEQDWDRSKDLPNSAVTLSLKYEGLNFNNGNYLFTTDTK